MLCKSDVRYSILKRMPKPSGKSYQSFRKIFTPAALTIHRNSASNYYLTDQYVYEVRKLSRWDEYK